MLQVHERRVGEVHRAIAKLVHQRLESSSSACAIGKALRDPERTKPQAASTSRGSSPTRWNSSISTASEVASGSRSVEKAARHRACQRSERSRFASSAPVSASAVGRPSEEPTTELGLAGTTPAQPWPDELAGPLRAVGPAAALALSVSAAATLRLGLWPAPLPALARLAGRSLLQLHWRFDERRATATGGRREGRSALNDAQANRLPPGGVEVVSGIVVAAQR